MLAESENVPRDGGSGDTIQKSALSLIAPGAETVASDPEYWLYNKKRDCTSKWTERPEARMHLYGSALRRLHNVFELKQRGVRRLRILRIHLRVQVVGDRAAPNNTGHRIVDIHHLAGRRRRNRLPKSRIDGLEIALRQHTLRINTVDGLYVGLRSLLEGGTIHGGSHHNHLVDRLDHLLRRLPGDGLREQAGSPVDVFDERVGSSSELTGSRADGAAR